MGPRRIEGPTRTAKPGEYRLMLSDTPSDDYRRRFLKLAETQEARRLAITWDAEAATLTFMSSGDLKADIRMIDVLLEEASR